MMYVAGRVRQDNGRWRWAALDVETRVWYFPTRYGQAAAWRLANRLNREC